MCSRQLCVYASKFLMPILVAVFGRSLAKKVTRNVLDSHRMGSFLFLVQLMDLLRYVSFQVLFILISIFILFHQCIGLTCLRILVNFRFGTT